MTLKELEALVVCYKSHCAGGPALVGEGLEEYEAENKAEKDRFWAEAELARAALAKAFKAKGYIHSALKEQ